jgi:hypothetical protein
VLGLSRQVLHSNFICSLGLDQLVYKAVKGVSDEFSILEKFELECGIVFNTDANTNWSRFSLGSLHVENDLVMIVILIELNPLRDQQVFVNNIFSVKVLERVQI